MDLSNLSSTLPPSRPVDSNAVNEVNRELLQEFKNAAKSVAMLYHADPTQKAEFANAAKSVAALYKLSTTSTSLLKYSGYLSALDDMLDVIACGGDIENWVLTRRAELTKEEKKTEKGDSEDEEDREGRQVLMDRIYQDLEIPSDFKFTVSHDNRPKYPFVPSYPPLSVRRKKDKQREKKEKQRKEKPREKKEAREKKERDEDEHDTKRLKRVG